MRPVELVLSKLPDAKRNARGWQARCPAHDDRQPSLSIAEGDDGRALLRCHAGCSTEAVAAALGVTIAQLMPPSTLSRIRKPTRKAPAPRAYATTADAVTDLERQHGHPVGRWTYHDAAGEPLGIVLRWNTPEGKIIRPVSRTAGGWIVGGMAEPRPLYRLPELLARPYERVYVCEGEKAADAAASVGLLATTSPHGSKSAAKADWQPLACRDVVIMPDNDKAGRQYAGAVAGILAGLNPPPRVRVVDLPELPDGGDFVEYLDTRHGAEPEAIRAEVERLADSAGPVEADSSPASGPVLVCLADVMPQAVQWLWPQRIALGKLNLIFGDPGKGKSFITLDMAARVSTGSPWPDRSDCAPKGSVILLNCEDELADTIRPRLDKAGANVRKIIALEAVKRPGEGGKMLERSFTLADLPALAQAVKQNPDCRLIVIDPVSAYLADSDSHNNAEIRGLLAPLAKLASDHRVAVVMVTHMSKAAGGRAMYRAMGSLAFIAAARSAWVVVPDKDNPKRRLFLPAKNNIGNDETGLAYCIHDGAVAWEHEPVTMKADEALAMELETIGRDGRPGPEPEARNAAAEWLRELLKAGATPAAKVKDEAKAVGYAWRTVQRGAETIGVIRRKCSFGGGWTWELPAQCANSTCQAPQGTEDLASWHVRENRPENADSELGMLERAKLNHVGTSEHETPVERQADRPAPEGIPPKVWVRIQAMKAAGGATSVPEGWTGKAWARELRRMADVCAANNPDQATEYRRQADELDKAA